MYFFFVCILYRDFIFRIFDFEIKHLFSNRNKSKDFVIPQLLNRDMFIRKTSSDETADDSFSWAFWDYSTSDLMVFIVLFKVSENEICNLINLKIHRS